MVFYGVTVPQITYFTYSQLASFPFVGQLWTSNILCLRLVCMKLCYVQWLQLLLQSKALSVRPSFYEAPLGWAEGRLFLSVQRVPHSALASARPECPCHSPLRPVLCTVLPGGFGLCLQSWGALGEVVL